MDVLLCSYCIEVMDNSAQASSSVGASWEERVITIVDCVDTVDVKLGIVVELMRRIHVPWSESIDSILKKVWRTLFTFAPLFPSRLTDVALSNLSPCPGPLKPRPELKSTVSNIA